MELIIIIAVLAGVYVIFFYKPSIPKRQSVEIPYQIIEDAESLGHRNPEDFARSVYWAHRVMSSPDQYVVIDTETTGINRNAVIVQIAVTDLQGNELLNSLVKPTKRKRIASSATAIHGISMKDLEGAPHFEELLPKLQSIVEGKTVLIYNAEYDTRLIDQTCRQDEINFLRLGRTECVMLEYSRYKGSWSDYHYEYRYQKLPGGDHSAIGDCRATIKVIEQMASHWPADDV